MDAAPTVLLAGLFDYAGLFPPAALPMERALVEYAGHRRGPERRALNRFVVPARRLEELASGLRELPHERRGPGPWRLAVIAGRDLAADLESVRGFTGRHGPALVRVEAVETAAAMPEEVAAARRASATGPELVFELPLDGDLPALVRAVRAARGRAKVRTGGVRAADFPAPEAVVAFLEACRRERVSFKATAGLHHPVRGPAPLTYEPDAPRATMFGYLNLVLASTALWRGGSAADARRILEEEDRDAFRLGRDEIAWRSLALPARDVAEARRSFVTAIGSCSFTEPLAELHELGAGIAEAP